MSDSFHLAGLLVLLSLSNEELNFLEKTYGKNWFEELALNLQSSKVN